jgi:hypothetical protein
MATGRNIPNDETLLAEGRAVMPPLPEREPRAGFAAMVASNAQERHGSSFAAWLRWSFGGFAVAAAAAVAVLLAAPAQRQDDQLLAQRLDLFEDMTVVQNQQALEDLDVVEVLHVLEARP